MIDIHNHSIPAVDDGASTIEDAMQILRREAGDGVRAVVCTPHYRPGMFETSAEEVLRQYLLLAERAKQEVPELTIFLGCEIHAHVDMLDTIRTRPNCHMADSDFVLAEFSRRHDRTVIRNTLQELRAGGLIPIIAHAERYPPITEDLDFLDELIALGCRVQLSADAIIGKSVRAEYGFCKKVLSYGMVHFVGSDAHDPKYRPAHMKECAKHLRKKAGEAYANEILETNPAAMLGL